MKRYRRLVLFICVISLAALMPSFGEGIVRVVEHSGDVMITLSGSDTPIKCQDGMSLSEGARIVTGKGAFVDVAFDMSGLNRVKVSEKSDVIVKLDGADKIELVSGEIYVLLKGLKKGESFQVKTPCVTCGARGTGWKTWTDGQETKVSVFDGSVFMRGVNRDGSLMEKEYWVKKGYEREVKRYARPEKRSRIPEKRLRKMERVFPKIKVIPVIDDVRITKDTVLNSTVDIKEVPVDSLEKLDRNETLKDRTIVDQKTDMIDSRSRIEDDRVSRIEKVEQLDSRSIREDRIEALDKTMEIKDRRIEAREKTVKERRPIPSKRIRDDIIKR